MVCMLKGCIDDPDDNFGNEWNKSFVSRIWGILCLNDFVPTYFKWKCYQKYLIGCIDLQYHQQFGANLQNRLKSHFSSIYFDKNKIKLVLSFDLFDPGLLGALRRQSSNQARDDVRRLI
jgi:hypothetical protein